MKIPFIPWMNILNFTKVKFLHMIWVDIWKFWHSMFHFPIYQFVSEICVYVQIVEDSIIICKALKYLLFNKYIYVYGSYICHYLSIFYHFFYYS